MNFLTSRNRYIFPLCCAVIAMGGLAVADVLTYNYTGLTRDIIGTPFGIAVNDGDAVTGSFTYDTAATQTGSAGTFQTSFDDSAEISVTLTNTGDVFTFGTPAQARVSNDFTSSDIFQITTNSDTTAFLNGVDTGSTQFRMELRDSTQTVFSDLSLPTSLDLNDFDAYGPTTTFVRLSDAASDRFFVELTSLTLEVAAVPEPSSILLLAGMGLMVCGRHRRRSVLQT